MSVYAIAKRGREFLDTPVFYAGSSDDEETIVVFTDRDSANQYIADAGWSDHEVGELTSLQLLHLMVKAHADGTRFLAVNPDRTGHSAGKPQVVVTIEEKLNVVADSISRDLLGESAN
jgi:hypothetical protein